MNAIAESGSRLSGIDVALRQATMLNTAVATPQVYQANRLAALTALKASVDIRYVAMYNEGIRLEMSFDAAREYAWKRTSAQTESDFAAFEEEWPADSLSLAASITLKRTTGSAVPFGHKRAAVRPERRSHK